MLNVKLKNFTIASSFARRMLEMNPNQKQAAEARKVLHTGWLTLPLYPHHHYTKVMAAADANNTNAVQINYDEKNPFVVCVC